MRHLKRNYPTIVTIGRFARWSLAALKRMFFGIGGVCLLTIVGLYAAGALVEPLRWYLVGIATTLLLLAVGLLALSYVRFTLDRFISGHYQSERDRSTRHRTQVQASLDELKRDLSASEATLAELKKDVSDTRKPVAKPKMNAGDFASFQQGNRLMPEVHINRVNHLPSKPKVKSSGDLLLAYCKAGIKFLNAIDGGAGWGAYSEGFLRHIQCPGVVFAFEPFPGNFRFFDEVDQRIILIKKALYSEQARRRFFVVSTVSKDSDWGKKGFAGCSSVGKLIENQESKEKASVYDVECVAADAEIPPDKHISFIKLDLQGGELNALKGMHRILTQPYFLWIEFTGQPGLIEYILDMGYILFDTEYLFWGAPSKEAVEHFEVSSEGDISSTGRILWKGFKRRSWGTDYISEFTNFRKRFDLVQTDLVCVNRRFVDEFFRACDYLS